MKRIFALLLIVISLSSCEKDDICVEETTPRLIIEFYDSANNANLRDVVDLKVKADGAADFMVFNAALPETDNARYLFNGSKLSLPLRIDGTATKYSLTLNSTSVLNANEDFLEFNYTTQNVFVSRACGYKTIFTLNATNGVVKTDTTTPIDYWIEDFNILTTNITTEDEVHIKVYL